MTVDQAISQIIGYVDNVSATDSSNTDRKTRTLNYLQESFNFAYYWAEWWFRWKLYTVAISANATSGTLDTEFSDLPGESAGGQVYNSATGGQLRIVDPSRIMERQQTIGASTANPDECSVFGQAATGPYQALLQLPKVSVAVTLNVWAHKKPPTLALGGDQLDVIPSQWHQLVLIPGARMFAQKSKGDVKEWQSHRDAGLALMKAAENQVKGGNFGLPSFFGD